MRTRICAHERETNIRKEEEREEKEKDIEKGGRERKITNRFKTKEKKSRKEAYRIKTRAVDFKRRRLSWFTLLRIDASAPRASRKSTVSAASAAAAK